MEMKFADASSPHKLRIGLSVFILNTEGSSESLKKTGIMGIFLIFYRMLVVRIGKAQRK